MNYLCLDCQKPISGRADKKFCNDQCRNNFNNLLRASELRHLKQINQVLKKNRAILKAEALEGRTKIARAQLVRKGFNFAYHTHLHISDGLTYCFCYEYGYAAVDNGEMLLLKGETE